MNEWMKKERKKERKKKKCNLVDFALLTDHRVKRKESEKIDKYLDLAKELKSCGTWSWNGLKGFDKETEGIGDQK